VEELLRREYPDADIAMLDAWLAELRAARREQGLPEHVEDAATLDKIACAVVASRRARLAREREERAAARGRRKKGGTDAAAPRT
jgi:hypothetical protein